MRIGAVTIMGLMLAGCGGMSKDECLNADWRLLGYEDGSRGAPISAITPRRKACADKAGITPDMDAYIAGRSAGLQEFCRPSRGFSFGSGGGHYLGVCPADQEPAFLIAYEKGSRLYALSANVAQANSALHRAHEALADVEHRIDHAELALVSPETPHLERIDYVVELKNLVEERRAIEADIAALSDDLELAEIALADYQARLAEDGVYSEGRKSAEILRD